MRENYYKTLGIDNHQATFSELKRAYYRRAKSCHPDLFGNSSAKTEEFKLLVTAFEVLSDPFKRSYYDAQHNPGDHSTEPFADISDNPYAGENDGVIMDTDADDTLEELFVGNSYPQNTSLATIFVDLRKTDTFLYFREGKNLFYSRQYEAAKISFMHAAASAPRNIVFQVYLARTFDMLGQLGFARSYYKTALRLGSKRRPPQKLAKVHEEFESVKSRHRPLWNRVVRMFAPPRAEFVPCPAKEMIDETNKALANIHKDRQRKKKKMLK